MVTATLLFVGTLKTSDFPLIIIYRYIKLNLVDVAVVATARRCLRRPGGIGGCKTQLTLSQSDEDVTVYRLLQT